MDTTDILKFLVDTPFALVMLYLLIREQAAHMETRHKCMEQYSALTDKFIQLQHETMAAIDKITPNK